MAKEVSEVTIIRFEYTVINEKFYLEVEPCKDTFKGKLIDYYRFYLKRGECGMKRFIYGCPKVDQTTGQVLSVDDAAKNTEMFLLDSIVEYVEEDEAIQRYYADKCCD